MALEKDRAATRFDVRALAYRWDGDAQATKRKEDAWQLLESNPQVLPGTRPWEGTLEQRRERTARQIHHWVETVSRWKQRGMDPQLIREAGVQWGAHDGSAFMRYGVHAGLFYDTLRSQGTPEQWDEWKADIEQCRVLGCFAMTELGASSFLRGLETTATFDVESQSFIINSPSLTSTKWWIGMAGQTATHTVCLARVIDGSGKDTGALQWFVVPLRDRQTGQLAPNVRVGDIGEKAGRHGLDNGWIQFQESRVPKSAMLAKWAQISPEGVLTASPNAALAYATLIGERVNSLVCLTQDVSQALTIATRYTCVRVQGARQERVLDYQLSQVRLLPCIARLYAIRFASLALSQLWEGKVLPTLESGDASMGTQLLVAEVHTISSGIKSWGGWWACHAIETARRLMGGHGYSMCSRIPTIQSRWAVFTQGGGPGGVIAQQVSRYLLGSLRNAMRNKPVGSSVSYLKNIGSRDTDAQYANGSCSVEDMLNPTNVVAGLEWLALGLITRVGQQLMTVKSKDGLAEAWNNNQEALLDCSRIHIWRFMAQVFSRNLSLDDSQKDASSNGVDDILRELFQLFAVDLLIEELPLLFELNHISSDQATALKQARIEVCSNLRWQAVGLTDAFLMPDWFLVSPLGRYDGDVYPAYFDAIKDGVMSPTPSHWQTWIRPLTNQPRSRL